MWNVKWGMGNGGCEMWNVKCEMWNVKCDMGNVKCEMGSVKCDMGNVKCEMWYGECEMINGVGCFFNRDGKFTLNYISWLWLIYKLLNYMYMIFSKSIG